MATSSVSGSSSVNGSNFIMALGSGSGIDIKTLANNLVEAEKQPKTELIQKAIDKSTAQISGYGIVANAIGQIQSALDALADPELYSKFTNTSSLPNAVTVSAGLNAVPGTHKISVQKLAQAQRSVSNGIPSQSSISATPFRLTVNLSDGTSKFVDVNNSTPEGIRDAVNTLTIDTKVSASLVNTGTATVVVLTGAVGKTNGFSVTTDDPQVNTDLGFVDALDPTQKALAEKPPNLLAQDAEFTVDGIPNVTRSSNTVTDLFTDVTVNLLDVTIGATATVGITRDTTGLKSALQQLVSNYNDTQSILDAAMDPKSTVDKLGGSLAGASAIRSLRDQVRRILMPETGATSNPDEPLKDLRQLGLFIDRDAKMKFASMGDKSLKVGDTSNLDKLLSTRFEDVRKMFLENSVPIGSTPDGFQLQRDGLARAMADQLGGAGRGLDAYKIADQPATSTPLAMLSYLQANEQIHISSDQKRLADLNDRMGRLLESYIKQFAAMDSLVGQSKSVQTGIENSFKGMSNSK